jgi:hypothetical protein
MANTATIGIENNPKYNPPLLAISIPEIPTAPTDIYGKKNEINITVPQIKGKFFITSTSFFFLLQKCR